MKRLAPEIQKSLKACYREGIAASVMMGVIDYYMIPLALFLGASTQQIGFLVAIPNLVSALSQFMAVRAVKLAGSRLRLLVGGIGVQAMLMLPLAFIGLRNFPYRVELLIVLTTFFRLLGTLIGPAWGSLVSDYLPENLRGNYLGYRSRASGLAGIVGISFWGLLLYLLKKISSAWAFSALFAGATFFRMVSFYYMRKMTDLPMHHTREHDFTFWMFIRRFRESNFVKFIFYVAGITFATQMAVPYFSVYMLRDMKLNYLMYMGVHLSSVLTGLISFPIWGKHADVVGNAHILKITSFFLPILPLLWIAAPNGPCLALVEMFGGFVWGGFNLCSANFIYDAVSPQKRVRCLGYFNLITGAAVFAGASIGGYLADKLPPIWGKPLGGIFLLSAFFRFCADFFLSNHFQEVRRTARKVSSGKLFFSVAGIRPILGENTEPDILPPLRQPVPH